MKNQHSIRFLLLAALAAAFSLILVLTVFYNARSQRDHMEEFSQQYVDGLAKSYFDGLNTMMVTGTIANRDLLRDKVMAPKEVLDARLNQQLLASGGIQAIIFAGVFVLTALVLARLVFSRLRRLHDRMDEISRNSDLTLELDVGRNDEIGSVARAFNRMMAKIRESMHMVMDNAGQVEQAARSIAEKSETTEREVRAQRDNTDQVASATTEMAASAVQVRENAIHTTRKSADTAAAASAGEQLARNAVEGIQALNNEVQAGAQRIEQLDQRTGQMADMLEVISNIADQTNLLALNAAIEAARAGEQGRGFSVVADEVRALASRTQDSTEDIRNTISDLKNEVIECVATMREASGMADHQVQAILRVESELQTIALAVREITDLNQEMESAANEQSDVSESINHNVIGISRSAEQTSQDAQETSRIGGELLTMAESLRQTIEQFRLVQR